jgi:phage/plasmid-like protein (TIGR03299 family)
MNITDTQYNEFLADNRLNYDVEMVPQHITNPQGEQIVTGFCPVRLDTFEALGRGGMTKNFKPIQNADAFRVIPQMAKLTDMELVKGDTWNNGAGVYAQVSLGTMTIGDKSKGDDVEKFLTVINSHDGSRALNIIITPKRVFCQNCIAGAIRDAGEQRFIIRHNASAEIRLEELVEDLRIIRGEFERTEELYNRLHGIKVSTDALDAIFNKAFPKPAEEAGPRSQTIWTRNKEAAVRRFREETELTGWKSAWGVYNAVQGTIQHDSRQTTNKDHSVLVGSIAGRSKKVMEDVLELV